MNAFAVHAGPGTSPPPLEMAYSAKPPEIVLFRELIRSGSNVSRGQVGYFEVLTREQQTQDHVMPGMDLTRGSKPVEDGNSSGA